MKIIKEAIENYSLRHTSEESALLQDLKDRTDQDLKYSNMLTNRMVGGLLQFLIQLGGYQNVLEVGMFTGYSALTMAEVLPDNGELVTLEMNERYENIARSFLERSPHGDKVRVVMGMAQETLKELEGEFDLAFIDADKQNYPLYYDLIKPHIKSGGMIVVDNAFWSGKVLTPGEDEQGEAVDKLNKKIKNDAEVKNVLLTVRDGLHLACKL